MARVTLIRCRRLQLLAVVSAVLIEVKVALSCVPTAVIVAIYDRDERGDEFVFNGGGAAFMREELQGHRFHGDKFLCLLDPFFWTGGTMHQRRLQER